MKDHEKNHYNGATLAAAYDGLDRMKHFRRGSLEQTNRYNDTLSEPSQVQELLGHTDGKTSIHYSLRAERETPKRAEPDRRCLGGVVY